MAKQLIAVMGATGTQGCGVVDELLARKQFAVRNWGHCLTSHCFFA